MANYTQIVNYSKEQTYIVIDSYIAKDRHRCAQIDGWLDG